jgi:hypothetical protein
MKCTSTSAVLVTLASLIAAEQVCADEIPPPFDQTAKKGLEWLAKAQHPEGYWASPGDSFPVALTALSGTAMLMEGSTLRGGKYADNLHRATGWLIKCAQSNGLISQFKGEGEGYMHGHGFALLFLAQVYGEEEERKLRSRLEDLLTQGVSFLGRRQSSHGGWSYYTIKDEWDEVSVTVTQMQALRACRNAGIAVPKEMIDRARKYLRDCTTEEGGIRYGKSTMAGHARPALTAAAIASAFSAGEYNSSNVRQWLEYCRKELWGRRTSYDEYADYYWAQCIYMLGDKGWSDLFPGSVPGEQVTWTRYRRHTFDFLRRAQNADGSWSGSKNWRHFGPVYSTATALTILQLDKAALPMYQR